MPKKRKTEKRKKKREKALRQEKAKKRALPKILRDEVLRDALSTRHPLRACLINEEWQQARIASILVSRDGPGGQVFGNFLVDLAERGLKDAWGGFGSERDAIETAKSGASRAGFNFIPCDLELAANIVHGGIAWARKWGYGLPREYQIWIRLLERPHPSQLDLGLFGMDGKPFSLLDHRGEGGSYGEILSCELQSSEAGLTPETLTRIGDIKGALVHFAQQADFEEDIERALEEWFGESKPPDSEEAWIEFLDWFLLEYELEGGETVARRFVEDYGAMMSEDVRELVLGWERVIEGLYEVKEVGGEAVLMKNLVNEREYRVFSTVDFDDHAFHSGDFLFARIVPAKDFHVFSGTYVPFSAEGSDAEVLRVEAYRQALEIQTMNPRLAFEDNPEKLEESRRSARKYYELFVALFDAAEVISTGKAILAEYRRYIEYAIRELRDGNEMDMLPAYPPEIELPKDILASDDAGMLCDPVEGLFFLVDYGRFINVFRSPEQHLGKKESEALVMRYLESDSVSDVPFRRMAERFPEHFKRVIEYYRDREGFSSTNIADLMQEFKPWSSEKLPGIVAVLDSAMAKVAKASSSSEEPSSGLSRPKKWFRP